MCKHVTVMFSGMEQSVMEGDGQFDFSLRARLSSPKTFAHMVRSPVLKEYGRDHPCGPNRRRPVHVWRYHQKEQILQLTSPAVALRVNITHCKLLACAMLRSRHIST